jgi:large subunit ribosomal protein L9
MKVVLTQDVQGLGEAGQVKEVAEGYARNFLLPRKLAVAATPGALKQVEIQQAAEKKRQQKQDQEVQGQAKKLSEVTVTLRSKVGEGGKLYGSITNGDIAEALEKQLGQPVDRRKIEIEEPIRHVGSYKVPVKLTKNVAPTVTVIVEGLDGEQAAPAQPAQTAKPAKPAEPAGEEETPAE